MRCRLLLLVLAAVTPLAAHAASFDCSHAQSFREKTVCSDPNLSQLDDQLAAAYKSLRAQLSPEAAALVQSDQREWLHWLDQVCPAGNPALPDKPEDCLAHHYVLRLTQLTRNRVNANGISIYARAHFVLVPGKPRLGDPQAPNDPGFGYGEFSWPQIDRPTDVQRAFNEAVYAATVKSSCCMDQKIQPPTLDAAVDSTGWVYGDFTIIGANSQFIDITLGSSSYTGGAHPMSGFIGFPWLVTAQRLLTTQDIFTGPDWQQEVANLTYAKLLKDPGPDALWTDSPYTKAADTKKAIAAEVVRPASWMLNSAGFTITFGSYEVGPYSSGMPSAHFTWQELKPWLVRSFDPTTLPAPPPQAD